MGPRSHLGLRRADRAFGNGLRLLLHIGGLWGPTFDRSNASLSVSGRFCQFVPLGGLGWEPLDAHAASSWPVMASHGKVYHTRWVFYGLATLAYSVQWQLVRTPFEAEVRASRGPLTRF